MAVVSCIADDLSTAKVFTEDKNVFNFILETFRKADPNLKGPISVEESVTGQIEVIEGLSAEQSGRFLSHHGNRDWF